VGTFWSALRVNLSFNADLTDEHLFCAHFVHAIDTRDKKRITPHATKRTLYLLQIKMKHYLRTTVGLFVGREKQLLLYH
jgi:hypothetical protein